MIAALLPVWLGFRSFLARVPMWAWIALAGIVVVAGAYRIGHGNGRQAERLKLAPVIERLGADLGQCRANGATLQAALDAQSAKVRELGAATAKARAAEAEAEKRASQQRKALSGVHGRLIAETRASVEQPAMALTPAQREAWDALQ